MKVTFIGIYGGYPKAGGANASLLVEDKGVSIVIDMGSATVSHLESIKPIDEIDSVIITHAHYDHYADAPIAVYGRLISKQLGRDLPPLDFYGPSDPDLERMLNMEGVSRFIPVDGSTRLSIGPFSISFHRTIHPVECYAVSVESCGRRLFYTSDGAFSDSIAAKAAGADLLVAECSFLSKYGSGSAMGHMNGKECALFASKCNAALTRLIHIPYYSDTRDLEAEACIIPGSAIARELETLEL